jgi:replication initiator protein
MAGAGTGRELAISHGGAIDDRAVVLSEGSGDPQFLHAVLCQLGLPRSPTAHRTFERTSGRASLLLQAGKSYDGKKWVDQPLPSGTRPRLVLINLCSQSVRTQSPEVDIGSSVREFLRRLNIDAGGESMAQFRKQMMALSSCHMTLAMATATGTKQVDAKPIDAFQAWHTNEDGQQTLWPGYIRLTDKFFESLMEHAVPLQPEAIGQLQNSAFALDVYSWLAHRLCRVNEREGVRLSWAALKGQFGQEYADTQNFKRKFLGALRKATAAYQEARIETVTGGLKLLPSPPPVKRTTVMVGAVEGACADTRHRKPAALPAPLASPLPAEPATASAGGSVNGQDGNAMAIPLPGPSAVIVEKLVSERALEQVPGIAPGWDKYALAEKYKAWVVEKGEMPRHPDAAFVGWVRSYTKGVRP